jgi:cell division protease FtsH
MPNSEQGPRNDKKLDGNFKLPKFGPLLALLFVVGFIWMMSDLRQFHAVSDSIPYSEFLTDLKAGKLGEVSVSRDTIEGQFKGSAGAAPKFFVTNRVDDPNLVDQLRAQNVKFSGLRDAGNLWTGMFSWFLTIGFLALVWSFVLKRSGGMGRGGGFLSLGKSRAKVYVETDLKVRFGDVAGVDEAKEELTEIVNFLREPVRYSLLGGRMPRGILLIGPPGTGKTLLARAVAGEAHVPFFSINGSEFVEMFVGLGAARVRDLFEQARAQAPCILFIDELDALGKARGISAVTGGANDEKEQTLNQLLAEMDGFDTSKGIIVLAATNRPEILDPALLRAGRFDRSILVDRPDRMGRAQILQVHMKKVKLHADADPQVVAGMTTGFSGADLANLVNEAALIATRKGGDAVHLHDFTMAIERMVAGLERKNRLLNPAERRRVAYHEMGHAITALALGQSEVIHKVSIIPRGIGALGYTLSRPTEDRYLMERYELEAKMAIALGGRASELRFFPDISTGAGDDLDKATEIARAMITRYGMTESLGLGVFERDPAPMLGSGVPMRAFEYSEATARKIDEEITRLMDKALKKAVEVVNKYQRLIEEAVIILLDRETIDENGLKELWNKHQSSTEATLTRIA